MPSTNTGNSSLFRDGWLASAVVVVALLYVALAFLKPGGEGWGRGWNLVAFWLYASPVALIAGGIALWRAGKSAPGLYGLALLTAVVALFYPIVALLVFKMKS